MAQWVGVQRWPNVVKKSTNTPTCGGPPREPQTENEKIFFRFWLEDLLNP